MAIFNSYVKLPEGNKKQKKIPRENSSENSHVLGVHSESSWSHAAGAPLPLPCGDGFYLKKNNNCWWLGDGLGFRVYHIR